MESTQKLRYDKSKTNLQLGITITPKLASSSPQILGTAFKSFLKGRKSAYSNEEDCPLCQQHIRQDKMPRLIHKALSSKYANSITYFYTKGVNDILAGNRSRALVELVEDSYWFPERECIVGFVPLDSFKERCENLWKYHQFNIDQPRHECRGINEIAEAYYNGKRKIQEKAIKKMLEVMTDSELEGCEIHLSMFGNQKVEIIEKPYEDSDRLISKALLGERKASSISLSIIDNISKGGKSVKPDEYLRHQLFKSPKTYMVFDWGEKDHFTDISKLFQNKTKQNSLSEAKWPSFIESSEQKKLDTLIKDQSEHKAIKQILKLDKHFAKKTYKEILSPYSQSKTKFKSNKIFQFSSPSSSNLLPLGLKSKKRREELVTEKTSKEKVVKKSVVEEGSFLPNNIAILSAIKSIKIKENVISELKNKPINQVAISLAMKSKRKENLQDLFTPVRKLMSNFKTSTKTATSTDNNKKLKTTKSIQKSTSRSRSNNNPSDPKIKTIRLASQKIVTIEKPSSTSLGKKIRDLNQVQSKPMSTREHSYPNQKFPLDSTSTKSLGVSNNRFDSSSKRLKSRPRLMQELTASKTIPAFGGYDPFFQSGATASSPRQKSSARDSRVNVYSSSAMHKIIANKRYPVDASLTDCLTIT